MPPPSALGPSRTRGAWRPDRSPRALRVLPLLLGLLLLGAPRSTAGGEGAQRDRWEAVRRSTIERLHELATWCNGKRLYGCRASTYELVLAFDADDEEARKRLRYKRARDGRWTRKPRAKPPRNFGTGKKQFEADLTAWRAWLLGEVHPMLTAAREVGDARLCCEILRAALPAAPADDDLRRANGEVEHTWNDTTRWVLSESQVAKARRHVLERIGAAVVLEVPDPSFAEPRPDERCEGVAWGQVLRGGHVRVLGTASPPEMDEHYAYAEATWPVLAAVLSLEEEALRPAGSDGPLTIYVTRSAEVGNRFLRAQPGLEPVALDRLLRPASLRLPERNALLVKDASRTWRLEAGAKELVALVVDRALGVGDDDAWLAEGLAHYVTRLVTRTRQVFRTGDGTQDGVAMWLGSPDASVNLSITEDWLGAGHDLLTSHPDRRPDLLGMAARDLRTITPNEVLLGTCLTAYLLEGHPRTCTALLRTVGRTAPAELEAAVLAHLGYDLPTLEARLVRWLAETTGRTDRR